MFNNYVFYIYQGDDKLWTWRIEGPNKKIIGRAEEKFEKMQNVIDEVLKIVKINRWEKEEKEKPDRD